MVQRQPKQMTPPQLNERRLAAKRHFPLDRAVGVSPSKIVRAASVGRKTVPYSYAVWQTAVSALV